MPLQDSLHESVYGRQAAFVRKREFQAWAEHGFPCPAAAGSTLRGVDGGSEGEADGQGSSAQAAQELRSEVVFLLTSGTSSLPAFQGLVPVALPADAGRLSRLPVHSVFPPLPRRLALHEVVG